MMIHNLIVILLVEEATGGRHVILLGGGLLLGLSRGVTASSGTAATAAAAAAATAHWDLLKGLKTSGEDLVDLLARHLLDKVGELLLLVVVELGANGGEDTGNIGSGRLLVATD